MNRAEAYKKVGSGWSKLIDRFYDWVDFIDDAEYDVQVTVVGNRIGMLEIHAVSTDEMIQDMMDRLAWTLERDSAKVCEVCGEKGARRKLLQGSPNRCYKHYIELANQQGWK